jgi:ERCC4-type nuclease
MLYVDKREPATLRQRIVAALKGETDTRHLDTADYWIFDKDGCTLAIERKEVGDLLNSFGQGRLGAQLARMGDGFVPLLLVEGQLKVSPSGKVLLNHRETGWYHSAVQMLLFSLQARGIRVLFSAGHEETADILRILHQRGQTKCLGPTPGPAPTASDPAPPAPPAGNKSAPPVVRPDGPRQ